MKRFYKLLLAAAVITPGAMATPDHKHGGVCGHEEMKLHDYSIRLDKWTEKLEACKLEAEEDSSKTCFYQIKYTSFLQHKVTKWLQKLEDCRAWYGQSDSKG